MANNETVRVKIKTGAHWYREHVGKEFEVTTIQNDRHWWEIIENGFHIYKPHCEIIPSTDLIPFDWEKWESGQYEAERTNLVSIGWGIKSIQKIPNAKPQWECAIVFESGEAALVATDCLQLRLKVVERFINLYEHEGISSIRKPADRIDGKMLAQIKLTYAPGSDPGKDAPTHCEIVK